MTKLTITKGLPASGKTTWAKAQAKVTGAKLLCKDDLRTMIDAGLYSQKNERLIQISQNTLAETFLRAGHDVIIADTNLNPKVEKAWSDLAFKCGVEFEIKSFLDVTLEECIKRDQNRPNYVGEKVIRDMYNKWLSPKSRELVVDYVDNHLPNCIIVDVDGTLAHNASGRGWFDWHRVGEDTPIKPVIDLITHWSMTTNHRIVLLSGRDSVCREETLAWLTTNLPCVDKFNLFMRPEGDNRKDSIIKRELYDKHIKGNYCVRAVFDDRLAVCKMWHELGLPLFRVGNPEANF